MGYWASSLTGQSLQLIGDLNPDGTEMLWGDAPADAIDDGLGKLITRLHGDLGRWPTAAEIDAVKSTAPEMTEAISEAILVFHDDIGRQPTDGEITAGLEFSDTEISLDSVMRRTIAVGDTVRWPVMIDRGFYSEVDHIAEGVVDNISEQEITDPIFGGSYRQMFYDVRDGKGLMWGIKKGYVTKVLSGDKPVDEVNADRDRRLAEEPDED